uniref:X-box-binding protein 1 n=1 Tax=Lepeophtheirus salmonis TaxID=72036 RepID=A0A0K2TDY9_LEPSM
MSVSVVKTGERVLKMKGTDMKIGRPQIIIVPPGFLKTTTTMAPVKIAKISPKEPLKRPSPCLIESHLNPVRKRANLDHLSTEEKLLRRKLKNRVAAQNARDKKRVRMDDMEDEIRALRERNEKLEKENARLRELQARLEVPSEILDDCSLSATTTFELPLSPATSSSSEEEELSTIIVETPESMPSLPAERVYDLQQKGRATIVGPLLLLWTLLLSLAKQKKLTTTVSKRLHTSSHLPLPHPQCPPLPPSLHLKEKKMHHPLWWGPRQKAWNPRIWIPS